MDDTQETLNQIEHHLRQLNSKHEQLLDTTLSLAGAVTAIGTAIKAMAGQHFQSSDKPQRVARDNARNWGHGSRQWAANRKSSDNIGVKPVGFSKVERGNPRYRGKGPLTLKLQGPARFDVVRGLFAFSLDRVG